MKLKEHYHHGDLRQALIREALEALENGGEAMLSLRALAKAAGVSPNAPYRHFESRRELLAALAAEGFGLFADSIEAASRPQAPAVESLVSMGEAYITFAGAHPALYRLMFSPLGYSLESETCAIQSARAFGLLVGSLARAQAEGFRPEARPEVLVIGYWSELHGYSTLRIDSLVPREVAVPEARDILLHFFALDSRSE